VQKISRFNASTLGKLNFDNLKILKILIANSLVNLSNFGLTFNKKSIMPRI
jgi:hypothetical protein